MFFVQNNMKGKFEIGQKVTTPKGDGVIESIQGSSIVVKFSNGDRQSFPEDKISDNSDAG
jgi:hypothetical protein